MKWTRYAAFAVGVLSGTVFLLYVRSFANYLDIWEVLTLLSGPLTLLAASLVGLKFERVAGWWLLAGAAVTAILLCVQLLPWEPGIATLLIVPAIFCLPMLFSGLLWLSYAHGRQPTGAHLPMVP